MYIIPWIAKKKVIKYLTKVDPVMRMMENEASKALGYHDRRKRL